jgi:hypothetical protein
MTDQTPIYVDDELFLGRLDEQDCFRDALRAMMASAKRDPDFDFVRDHPRFKELTQQIDNG